MSINRIDKALGEYYKSVGQANYFSNGVGLFRNYCEENEFDSDHLIEEFKIDASDSILLEFDDEFPLMASITDSIERDKEIFRILKHCNDFGSAYIKHKIEPNKHGVHIWNVNLHINNTNDSFINSLIYFIKLKYFKGFKLEYLSMLIVNGFIREINTNAPQSQDILDIIAEYYSTPNKPNEACLFRSLIMSILYLISVNSNLSLHYNRLTPKQFEFQTERIKREYDLFRNNNSDDNYSGDDDDYDDDAAYLQEMKKLKLDFQNQFGKYNWLDFIHENDENKFNFDIHLYENDFTLNDMHKLFKKKEKYMENIQCEETMLSRLFTSFHQLIGPINSLDKLYALHCNATQIENKLLLFDNEMNDNLFDMVIKWYCHQEKKHKRVAVERIDGDAMYFGLLNNSFYVDTAKNILYVSFLTFSIK
eukprot:170417_1